MPPGGTLDRGAGARSRGNAGYSPQQFSRPHSLVSESTPSTG